MAEAMDWRRLMSPRRLTGEAGRAETYEEVRSPFQKDADRVIYSAAFRRLQDKTQVYPFPGSDFVRTRLTHSLEVASVGRSLGTYIGRHVLARHGPLEPAGYRLSQEDFGEAVAAACLAHDIGNPPFGHAGEDAIRHWFRNEGAAALEGVTPAERLDLENFEGNAQGFRILTRLQAWRERGGLRLSVATLGAFSKYPNAAAGQRKFGFFQDDAETFAAVADALGLAPRGDATAAWCRHPLAFLAEAADDICYNVVDLEDGAKAGKIKFNEAEELLRAVSGSELPHYHDLNEEMDRLGYLRAKSIGALVEDAKQVFLDNEADILDGRIEGGLLDRVPSRATLEQIGVLCDERLFNDPAKLESELGGFEVVRGLMQIFGEALMAYQARGREHLPPRYRRLLRILPEAPAASHYGRLLRLTDYVSGMTDRFAVGRFRRLKGLSLGDERP